VFALSARVERPGYSSLAVEDASATSGDQGQVINPREFNPIDNLIHIILVLG